MAVDAGPVAVGEAAGGVVERDAVGLPRYTMIESVWHYAREKLEAAGELDTLRNRHVAYFLTFAESAATHLEGPQQKEWLDRCQREIFNFRFAWEWCIRSRQVESGYRLIGTLWRFIEVRTNLEDAKNILAWARARELDIVFNMLRFTDNMLGNRSLEDDIGFEKREEEFMQQFFLERVQEESVLSGQAFMYLHYADMIANGYQRTMPCPFRTQGLLLNPEGTLFYCENSRPLGNVLDDPAETLYFEAGHLADAPIAHD